ncbi:zinc finger, CCHC-type containing protein [Tanacetum coccineum]
MGDENPIRTLGDYSKPSHEGYRNTIELPVGNNVDFLKLVDSLDLDGENRERTHLHLFQFSLRDQPSNWLERLPAGSITTWKDLTTRILAQFFPPGRTAKLRNDILMFQQHHEESLSEAWTRFKDLLQKVPHHGIDLWLQSKFFLTMSILSQDEPLTNWPVVLDDFDSHQEKRLSHLRTQLEQQQDDMIGKINLLWKIISKNLNDAPIPESAGDFMAFKNTASISHIEMEELRRKGIKIPSNLFSPKYLFPASIIELNKNPSGLKLVHFVNSIVILSKESEAEEGETTTDITPEHSQNITKEAKGEVKEVMEEDKNEVETAEEVEEILEDEEEEEEDEDDTTSIIDRHLGEMDFGRPFIDETGLVFSTWMTFGGNTRDLGSFGEETNEITDLHQIHEEILFSERGDGVAGIKRRRRDPSSDGRYLVMASGRGRLNEDLESYM